MYLLALTYAHEYKLIFNPIPFLEGLILVSILWGGLYSLNDLTDIEADKRDKLKSNRPFTKGDIRAWNVILFALTLIVSSLIFSYFLDPLFCIVLLLMVLNQLLYTLPPLRLKETSLAPLNSTATNNILRLASAGILLGGVSIIPASIYILMFTAGLGTYLMYKRKLKETSLISIIFLLILYYAYNIHDISLSQILIVIVPSFIATVPLYLSNILEREKMVKIADIIYHRILLVFYLACIIILLLE
ncbi:MAG TPA: UbiA family prenyltransferase [Methanothermobacter sp.]|nr:UbiA family prenyltransferase [Methanothermobacter sp.]HPQ05175.1 UbiA family prenyltransferase [Methanothermobacter sp.]HPU36414.1 UbiA family prenyltransferase [Methanothermobacter sp.]